MALRHYVEISRPDHWPKNVFAIPGFVLAWVADPAVSLPEVVVPGLVVAAGLCLTASSNYVLNEWLDAPYDRAHPEKRERPAARGDVTATGCIALWLGLGAAGIALGFSVGVGAGSSLLALWVMGVVYNVPPVRTKELPYVDVISESANNPIRLWAGWAATGTALIPPVSLLLAYWALGAFFMAMKRYAELRQIGDPEAAAAYRRSFRFYTEERLLVSIVGYVAASAMFGGIFVARYRLELVLAVPMVAGFFANYLQLGLQPDSPTAKPELLYRQWRFVGWSALTFGLCLALLVVDMPMLYQLLTPSIPTPTP